MVANQESVPSFTAQSLRKKILNVALTAPEFRTILDEAAEEIRDFATRPRATEATVEGVFERVLYAHLQTIGLKFHPEKEVGIGLKRHLTRGRMDSRLGALVIEYKRPSLLKTQIQIERGLDQLKNYLRALSEESSVTYVGFLTNGLQITEVRALDGEIVAQSAFEIVSGSILLRLTQQFIALAHTALTPSNLIRDFCGSNIEGVLFQTARVLNSILSNPQPKTQMLSAEWKEMFRLAHDDQSQQKRIEDRRKALASLFSIEITGAEIEYQALFAINTAYAILLKFMAYRTVSDIYLGETGQDYRSLARSANTPLRVFCSTLEDGEVFRNLGIVNLLEGDFFSWYCDPSQWTAGLAESIRTILTTLARYEEAEYIFETDEVPDLFRDLYQAAVPHVVRSSFGEFYTPFWLAEHVLESVLPKSVWRAIDPCCGSGTFVIAAIYRIRKECENRGLNEAETLHEIISRVVAIDLNPLSVLTTRINYFIHISNLLDGSEDSLVIPVFLGDAATIPDRLTVGDVACLGLELKTLQMPIKAILPTSFVRNTSRFMRVMVEYEQYVKAKKKDKARSVLLSAIPEADRTFPIGKKVVELTDRLIDLERRGWNGIWARILSNFFTTACLGQFSVIIGNPPWIDWKNLPEGYRNRIKDMCIEKGLFSGAGFTGGINLNICALIAHVTMTNWLKPNGRLAFLMPRELANQASYEGWRRLGGKWTFIRFYDWSNVGHPFDPVKEDFMTFVVGKGPKDEYDIVPVIYFKRKKGTQKASEWKNLEVATDNFITTKGVAGQVIPTKTSFTFAQNKIELAEFGLVAGKCEYIGREGIEFYPQELQLFTFHKIGPRPGTVWLKNFQAPRSKYKIPQQRVLLETKYLFPLVKGPELERFKHNYSGLIVAFPYEESDPRRPISSEILRKHSPLLLKHYEKYREIIDKQTKFSDKIRGKDRGEFYGLARTGLYSFADVYVGYRDNTKWGAVVVSNVEMPWGEKKRFVFQNHAVSMCERSQEQGEGFMGEDEAHFICAILNTPIVERFIEATSDNRSYKIRLPVFVPLYNPRNREHLQLVAFSREAHNFPTQQNDLRKKSEEVYLNLCRREYKKNRTSCG